MEHALTHKGLMTVAVTKEFVAKIVIVKIPVNRIQCDVKTKDNVSQHVIILPKKVSLGASARKNGREKSAL